MKTRKERKDTSEKHQQPKSLMMKMVSAAKVEEDQAESEDNDDATSRNSADGENEDPVVTKGGGECRRK